MCALWIGDTETCWHEKLVWCIAATCIWEPTLKMWNTSGVKRFCKGVCWEGGGGLLHVVYCIITLVFFSWKEETCHCLHSNYCNTTVHVSFCKEIRLWRGREDADTYHVTLNGIHWRNSRTLHSIKESWFYKLIYPRHCTLTSFFCLGQSFLCLFSSLFSLCQLDRLQNRTKLNS